MGKKRRNKEAFEIEVSGSEQEQAESVRFGMLGNQAYANEPWLRFDLTMSCIAFGPICALEMFRAEIDKRIAIERERRSMRRNREYDL